MPRYEAHHCPNKRGPGLPSLAALLLCAGCQYWVADSTSTGGALCVGTDSHFIEPDKTVALPANAATTWTWTANTCLSGSCSRNRAASSSASVSGSVITVTSTATWEEQRGYGACTSDCRTITAQFELPALAPGTYTLKHDTREATIEVGGDIKRCPMM